VVGCLWGSVEGCRLDRAFIRRQFLIKNQFLDEVHINIGWCTGSEFDLFDSRLTIVSDENYFGDFVGIIVSDSTYCGEVGLRGGFDQGLQENGES